MTFEQLSIAIANLEGVLLLRRRRGMYEAEFRFSKFDVSVASRHELLVIATADVVKNAARLSDAHTVKPVEPREGDLG